MEEEKPYNNREIASMFSKLEEDIAETLINSRETKGKIEDIQRWRERVNGGLIVSVAVILPILGWALYTLSTLDQKISDGVASTLDNYEFEVVE